ncbi:hypothetical protein F8C76_12785 [Flagellimonas olearia]|uniref:Uncharacterized protein n=1 Tax=Flagellimonas olearia TaxID=552546 RepID=A0A444VNQ6_9FLAO|nr:hypothetical protein [Allomuricauda olearia]KAB7528728.1 hypothetical protein F8C76_12785 [Allomuricauda olearia]RYC52454.1 hypothetical protein DN53_11320 [Allomuricauda olearia]
MGSPDYFNYVPKSEYIFTDEDYGKPISERLSEILRRNASKDDLANIAIKCKVSFSTIRDVVYRTNSLTKANATAIAQLIYVAFENSIGYKIRSETDVIFLEELLNF